MTSLEIIIDNRESKIIQNINNDLKFEKKNLDIGDIIIKNDNIILIIERKTLSDLWASIKDGRYKEQKIRLIDYKNKNTNVYLCYLIENDDFKISIDILNGFKINSMFRDNIYIVETSNILHTVSIIEKIIKNFNKFSYNFIENNNYDSNIKTKKGDNLTKDICYINQLSQIPGISKKIAQFIASHYPSFTLLIDHLKENSYNILADLKINGRKIGKKAQNIYNFLL